MHELPELDNYRALLAEQFAGALITGVEITNVKAFQASEEEIQRDVVGKVLWFVERRGLHLLLHLDNGKRLLLRLGQGAYLYKGSEEDRPDRAAQVKLHFGEIVLYCVGLKSDDLQLLKVLEVEEKLGRFGYDALDKRLTIDRFIAAFAKKRSSIKTALMDQNVISGIGTVYSDEICYAAGLRPDAKIPVFERATWERLYEAMHKILKEAISHGGAGEQPFAAGDALTGGQRNLFQVYDREGQACPQCGGLIEKIEVSGRKAFVCSDCQKDQ
ncbi:endonuclease VIII [Paenibacillus sp. FSL H8-0548]|uniref:Fpg/Nei family DNA glycosylase n=1 Tax=Paenibacillus sp. FSL H8-0548 TaxID=1920422 RepID=UPI00096ECF6F|nr:DNA-formamidopyrimidine glycosylase family protein [Paenibacillus sp. FSL H8-0548]OMF38275.1 endonuclease VIII [Paenibacillus sp. FSL H8-0548]